MICHLIGVTVLVYHVWSSLPKSLILIPFIRSSSFAGWRADLSTAFFQYFLITGWVKLLSLAWCVSSLLRGNSSSFYLSMIISSIPKSWPDYVLSSSLLPSFLLLDLLRRCSKSWDVCIISCCVGILFILWYFDIQCCQTFDFMF